MSAVMMRSWSKKQTVSILRAIVRVLALYVDDCILGSVDIQMETPERFYRDGRPPTRLSSAPTQTMHIEVKLYGNVATRIQGIFDRHNRRL